MSQRSGTVLVVEADRESAEIASLALRREAYGTEILPDARDVPARLRAHSFVAVVIDLGLLDAAAAGALASLRTRCAVPVIGVTGPQTPAGLILGNGFEADDHLTRPFEARELVARVNRAVRRAEAGPAPTGQTGVYEFGGWTLNAATRMLRRDDGPAISLTGGEFELLLALIERANAPMSRDLIMDLTKSREWEPFDRSIDVLIGRLRKKLEYDPKLPGLIKTVRGVGYVFSADVRRPGSAAAPSPARAAG